MRQGLHEGLMQAGSDAAVQAVVITCAGRTFIAGADITEFGKPPTEPSLQSVLDLIENCPKPVVAAIHGTALGGGLEVTLACHYRVGVKGARFGLPEVKLGLLPGAGGTQRLPRVVGAQKALQMIVSGDPIGADEALKVGLIDEIVDGRPDGGGRRLRCEGPRREAAAQEDPRPHGQDRAREGQARDLRGVPEVGGARRRAASARRRTASRRSRPPSSCRSTRGSSASASCSPS